jgi:hypothetical protein
MSSLWEQRAARNEALFREVNRNIYDLEQRHGTAPEEPLFLCECADADCTDRLRVSVEAYLAVRAHPRRFLVVPGHERHEVERPVERHETYLVVEKTGVAGDFAERTQA